MPANTTHEVFKQPVDTNMRIWRFMNFTKFVSLLSSKSLYLPQSSFFDDPYEGNYPKANFEIAPEELVDSIPSDINDVSKWVRNFKQWTYINCWHLNEYESAAMWKLYSTTSESIAIETTYENLKQVLPEDVYLGKVNYIDYEKERLSTKNLFEPFVTKRKSFEHEKEIRIVRQDLPLEIKDSKPFLNMIKKNDTLGININVNLNELIKIVHISPEAPNYFFDLVKDVIEKYDVSCEVKKSDLYKDPIY
jgi:hypothetical protein